MIIVVNESTVEDGGIASSFQREGVSATQLSPCDFGGWVAAADERDVGAIDAVLIGDCEERNELARLIKKRTAAAIIALDDKKSLDKTLELFAAGVDDVVNAPCHAREILARVAAILRRSKVDEIEGAGDIVVFRDGREPIVGGEPMLLPRRELRILEYFVANAGRRVTKAQIFSSVYGLFEVDIDENVIESHISKLRKRLRVRLGRDPIDSKRHLGYMLVRN